ncbi:hypothetical protein D910_02249 [Dendroctonus ponderosae]|uniref:Senescence domain-containing protein n=1 Tax=Dendroctonus ponderosae TaxID=77166 RepID=U4U4D8_DENPD|nr:hypothetical protein D910_02249 [Dendroctonus ponderosae]
MTLADCTAQWPKTFIHPATLVKMSDIGGVNSTMWSTTYLSFKTKHDLVYKALEDAINFEEQNKLDKALKKYEEGILLIDDVLSIPLQNPENSDATWEKVCAMVQKIKRLRAEMLTRFNDIKTQDDIEPPPTYDEAMSSLNTSGAALNGLSVEPNPHLHEELVYSHPGVRLYFISPRGEVVSTCKPQLMKIYLLEGTSGSSNTPKAILQIGDWIYPLVPGASPCYKTDYGAFIIPDIHSDVPGSSVGIILPSDAAADVFDLLESILHGIITQETEQALFEEKLRRADIDHSSTRSWAVSQEIIKGAHKIGDFLNWGTPKIIDNMTPAAQPTVVPNSLQKGVQIAETATSKAVQVTGFVANKVGEGTMRLGQFLAPHIQKHGAKLLSSGFKMSEEKASEKMQNALTIAAGAVEGFATIYRGLKTSSSVLGTALKQNTVKVVDHKWGPQCASTAECSLSTVGNVYNTYGNAQILRPKVLLKNTAKGAGKQMVMVHSVSREANGELLMMLEPGSSSIRPKPPPRKRDYAELSSESDNATDEKEKQK